MDSHTLEGLTLRLEAAERGLRRARRAMWWGSVLVVTAIGGAAWWLGRVPVTGTPETVEAQHFVVRDAQGSARAVLQQSAGGSTQLVFFQDPLAGEEWRQHTSTGPFSFGVRSLTTQSQLMLGNRDGWNIQVSPSNLFFGQAGRTSMVMETASGVTSLYLADSTGHMQVLNADGLAGLLAKPAAKASPPAKHRRRR